MMIDAPSGIADAQLKELNLATTVKVTKGWEEVSKLLSEVFKKPLSIVFYDAQGFFVYTRTTKTLFPSTSTHSLAQVFCFNCSKINKYPADRDCRSR